MSQSKPIKETETESVQTREFLIYILDDEQGAIDSIKQFRRMHRKEYPGLEIETFTDTGELVDAAQKLRPDIICVDYTIRPCNEAGVRIHDGIECLRYIFNNDLPKYAITIENCPLGIIYTSHDVDELAKTSPQGYGWCMEKGVMIMKKDLRGDHDELFDVFKQHQQLLHGIEFHNAGPNYGSMQPQDLLLRMASPMIEILSESKDELFFIGSTQMTNAEVVEAIKSLSPLGMEFLDNFYEARFEILQLHRDALDKPKSI